MSAQKHSDGPWKWEPDDPCNPGDNYHNISAEPGYHNKETNTGFGLTGFMSEYDARLIASAPRLLKALQDIVEKLDDGFLIGEGETVHVNAREAIRKAIKG